LALAMASPAALGMAGLWSRPGPAFAQPAPGEFADMAGHWSSAVVSLLAAKGIINGFPDGTYRPSETLTRAQFAALAVAGLEGSATADYLRAFEPAFRDTAGHWASGWTGAASELGLVRGVGDGLYLPDLGMNRAQVAIVLVAALGWQRLAEGLSDEEIRLALAGFHDASAVPEWARGSVAIAVSRGLVRGYDDGTLRPLGTLNRGEAAALLARTLDRLGLLFDLGGVLWGVDQAGTVTLADVHGWESGADRDLRLATDDRTVWLRNGAPVHPADLESGDYVLAMLGRLDAANGKAAPVRCIYALAWDVSGQLVGAPAGDGITVAIAGRSSVTIATGAETRVYRNGAAAALSSLAAGDRVYALVDPLTGRARRGRGAGGCERDAAGRGPGGRAAVPGRAARWRRPG
jgi:hypothetical protein